jgi:hypothetical protein
MKSFIINIYKSWVSHAQECNKNPLGKTKAEIESLCSEISNTKEIK